MIAIVLVLTAVFLPVAFLGGLVGEMYRQFAVTIAVSVAISGFVALTLTPALCAALLRQEHAVQPPRSSQRFNAWFARMTGRYADGVRSADAPRGARVRAVRARCWSRPSALFRAGAELARAERGPGLRLAIPLLQDAASLERTEAVDRPARPRRCSTHPAVDEVMSRSRASTC